MRFGNLCVQARTITLYLLAGALISRFMEAVQEENTLSRRKGKIVILSPFIIIGINVVTAIVFGELMGKWSFVPVILIEWLLFAFFVARFGGRASVKGWLRKSKGGWGWPLLAVSVGCFPLMIFLSHYGLLDHWSVWLPWLLLALVNPWLEEFYWRGLLMDYTKGWGGFLPVLFTGAVFAANHAVFGINSMLFRGWTVVLSTLVMGLAWGLIYKKTGSLRWAIFSHFLVDLFNLSAPAFLDMFNSAW